MNIRTAQQLLFECELKFKPRTNYDKLRKRKRELCGLSRNTDCIIDADELAKIVKLALMKQQLRNLQIEIERLENETTT